MELTIDTSELVGLSNAMSAAPQKLQGEMADTTNALLAQGVGFAQEYVPVKDGTLKGSIHILDSASPGSLSGSYGTNLEYAYMREYGGTIYPRNGKYLVFFWEKVGAMVYATQVTQSGSHYMGKSMEALEPLAMGAFQKAVDRALDGIFG